MLSRFLSKKGLPIQIVETIVTLLTGYLITSIFDQSHEYPPAIGYVLSSFIGFFVVLFIEDYSDIKKGAQVNTRYWLSILAICFSLLYIIVNLVDAQLDINKTSIIISLLLIITIIIFYLFDGLKKSAETEIKNLVLEREKQYYIKQFELMESSVLNVASLKHDISNHIGTIGALIYSDEKSKALRYINQFDEFVDFGNRYITSGNPVIDSILNFKLGYLKSQEIVTNIDIVVPSDLYLEVFDMVVILGNLIDNAIEALEKLDDNKKLSVSIKYKLGILTISVENTFSGDISLNEKGIVTSKKDKDNHGLGLKNIESTLEKYDGIMEYEYTDNAFIVEILMYIN